MHGYVNSLRSMLENAMPYVVLGVAIITISITFIGGLL